jgi:hypothetical protein
MMKSDEISKKRSEIINPVHHRKHDKYQEMIGYDKKD